MGDVHLRITGKTLTASLFISSIFGIAAQDASGAPAMPGCVQSATSWVNASLLRTETHGFRVSYDATPLNSSMNAISGVSNGAATDYNSLAAAVRFNPNGMIDARNGGVFTASSLQFVPNATHRVIMDVNVATRTYSAYVVIAGVQHTIGTNLAFRSQQSQVTALSVVGALSAVGTQSICNISVTNETAPPSITKQPASASVASGQTSTFSVTVSGTPAATYQWSKNGAAIAGATGSSYTTPATTSSDNGVSIGLPRPILSAR